MPVAGQRHASSKEKRPTQAPTLVQLRGALTGGNLRHLTEGTLCTAAQYKTPDNVDASFALKITRRSMRLQGPAFQMDDLMRMLTVCAMREYYYPPSPSSCRFQSRDEAFPILCLTNVLCSPIAQPYFSKRILTDYHVTRLVHPYIRSPRQ